PRVDSTSARAQCKCHFRNSEFWRVTRRRLTKVMGAWRGKRKPCSLEFAEAEGQTIRTRDRDRACYLENISARTEICSEEFTNIHEVEGGANWLSDGSSVKQEHRHSSVLVWCPETS